MSWPVTGSLVVIKYKDEVVTFGQAMKLQVKVDYQTVRVLGEIFPKTFVVSFVTISGGFVVAETRDASYLKVLLEQIDESLTNSGPSTNQFILEAIPENGDAPTYTVQDVNIVDFVADIDISGKLLNSNVTFVGRKIRAS